MNGTPAPSISDLPRLARRHGRKMVLFCLLVMGADLAWIGLARRMYESEAKLYLRLGRESVTLDPSATTGQTVQLQQTQENQINSTLQILDNRYLAEQVADRVGVANILSGGTRDDAGPQASPAAANVLGSLSAIGLTDPETDRHRAIRRLQSRTAISSPRNSSILSLRCQAESPALAQQIAKAWVEIFLREHLRLTHTLGSHEFFAKQAETSKQQLAAAEQKLREAKSAAGLVSLEGQRKVLDDYLSGLRTRLAVNASSLAASKARVADLAISISALSPSPLAQKAVGVSEPTWALLRERRRELEGMEKAPRPTSPEAEAAAASAREQRKRIEAILAAEPDARSQHSSGSNPTYQALHQNLLTEQATLAALTQERRALEQQEEAGRQELKALNAQALQIVELERQVAILETQYRAQVEKTEQARINEALEREQISSVSVVQPATFVEKPLSPNKPLLLVLGAMVAIFGSVGVGLLADYRRRGQADASRNPPTPTSQVKPS